MCKLERTVPRKLSLCKLARTCSKTTFAAGLSSGAQELYRYLPDRKVFVFTVAKSNIS